MSKKRYLEAEMLKEFLRMGMKVGHIHTLRDVENYIDTQPEATPQEVAGQGHQQDRGPHLLELS